MSLNLNQSLEIMLSHSVLFGGAPELFNWHARVLLSMLHAHLNDKWCLNGMSWLCATQGGASQGQIITELVRGQQG